MKLYICPECKEVIADGLLSGSNTQCKTCASRISRDDLIECDSEDISPKSAITQISGQIPGFDNLQYDAFSFNRFGYSSLRYNCDECNNNESHKVESHKVESHKLESHKLESHKLESHKLESHKLESHKLESHKDEYPKIDNFFSTDSPIGNILNKATNLLAGNCDNTISIVHSFEDIVLPNKVTREYSNGNTTFIYEPKDLRMLIFAILWNFFALILVIGFFIALVDPSSITVNNHPGTTDDIFPMFVASALMVGIGVVLTKSGINRFNTKNWIDVDAKNIYIENGFSRKYQRKCFPRDPKKTHIVCEAGFVSNNNAKYYIKLESNNEEITLVTGLMYHKAQEIVRFLRTILCAQID